VIIDPKDRLAIFIDGADFHAAQHELGVQVDYRRLLEFFRPKCRFVRAYFYTVVVEEEHSTLRRLTDWLDYNGYAVVVRTAKETTDSSGRRKLTKGRMDVEIAVDAMELAEHLDHAILFSGRSELCRLIAALKRRGLRVTVVSTVHTHPPKISGDLRRQADQFVDIKGFDESIFSERPTSQSSSTD
jgi:uncharacterized LabA/DUF88 family protein